MEQVTFVAWLSFASFLFFAGLIKRNSVPLRIFSIVGAFLLLALGGLLWSIDGFIHVFESSEKFVKDPELGAFGLSLVLVSIIYLIYEGIVSINEKWWRR